MTNIHYTQMLPRFYNCFQSVTCCWLKAFIGRLNSELLCFLLWVCACEYVNSSCGCPCILFSVQSDSSSSFSFILFCLHLLWHDFWEEVLNMWVLNVFLICMSFLMHNELWFPTKGFTAFSAFTGFLSCVCSLCALRIDFWEKNFPHSLHP